MKIKSTIKLEEPIDRHLRQVAKEEHRAFNNLVEKILLEWVQDQKQKQG